MRRAYQENQNCQPRSWHSCLNKFLLSATPFSTPLTRASSRPVVAVYVFPHLQSRSALSCCLAPLPPPSAVHSLFPSLFRSVHSHSSKALFKFFTPAFFLPSTTSAPSSSPGYFSSLFDLLSPPPAPFHITRRIKERAAAFFGSVSSARKLLGYGRAGRVLRSPIIRKGARSNKYSGQTVIAKPRGYTRRRSECKRWRYKYFHVHLVFSLGLIRSYRRSVMPVSYDDLLDDRARHHRIDHRRRFTQMFFAPDKRTISSRRSHFFHLGADPDSLHLL